MINMKPDSRKIRRLRMGQSEEFREANSVLAKPARPVIETPHDRSGQLHFRKVASMTAAAMGTMSSTIDISMQARHRPIPLQVTPGMIKHARTWTALVLSTTIPLAAAAPTHAAERDGRHDFDFNFGTWKTHVSRLVHPLAGSKTWTDYDGTSVVRKVWNGRASLFELEVEGTAGHIEGVGLRLYNPASHQWNLNWANSSIGMLDGGMIGEFKNGRGEFYGTDTFNGRSILVRNGFYDITPSSSRFEQAFSADGGKTWETNWIMTFTR